MLLFIVMLVYCWLLPTHVGKQLMISMMRKQVFVLIRFAPLLFLELFVGTVSGVCEFQFVFVGRVFQWLSENVPTEKSVERDLVKHGHFCMHYF